MIILYYRFPLGFNVRIVSLPRSRCGVNSCSLTTTLRSTKLRGAKEFSYLFHLKRNSKEPLMLEHFHQGFRSSGLKRSLYVSLEIPRSTLKRLTQSMANLLRQNKQSCKLNKRNPSLGSEFYRTNILTTTFFAHIFRDSSKEANFKRRIFKGNF